MCLIISSTISICPCVFQACISQSLTDIKFSRYSLVGFFAYLYCHYLVTPRKHSFSALASLVGFSIALRRFTRIYYALPKQILCLSTLIQDFPSVAPSLLLACVSIIQITSKTRHGKSIFNLCTAKAIIIKIILLILNYVKCNICLFQFHYITYRLSNGKKQLPFQFDR